MPRKGTQPTVKKGAGRKPRRPKAARKSLRELNEWIAANHDALLAKARANSIRLTGKPTFGGGRRKKSA